MSIEVETTTETGFYLSVYGAETAAKHDVPEGKYAVICCGPNGSFFTIDAAGNVRGDPQKVERETLLLASDNLAVKGMLGLARLAIRPRPSFRNDDPMLGYIRAADDTLLRALSGPVSDIT